MDRTSILGDTIDYMKELLERIGKLQEEEMEEGTNRINLLGISKELKPNEVMVRNSPKVCLVLVTHSNPNSVSTQILNEGIKSKLNKQNN